MSFYLIDGYNLLFFLLNNPSPTHKKREETLSLVLDIAPLLKGPIWIIFDGSSEMALPETAYVESVKVEFSPKGMSADDYILEKLYGRKNEVAYTVITSDKKLAQSCKNLGVNVWSLSFFLQKVFSQKKAKKEEKKPSCESLKEQKRLQKIFEKMAKEN